jgi:hypothetical protein
MLRAVSQLPGVDEYLSMNTPNDPTSVSQPSQCETVE